MNLFRVGFAFLILISGISHAESSRYGVNSYQLEDRLKIVLQLTRAEPEFKNSNGMGFRLLLIAESIEQLRAQKPPAPIKPEAIFRYFGNSKAYEAFEKDLLGVFNTPYPTEKIPEFRPATDEFRELIQFVRFKIDNDGFTTRFNVMAIITYVALFGHYLTPDEVSALTEYFPSAVARVRSFYLNKPLSVPDDDMEGVFLEKIEGFLLNSKNTDLLMKILLGQNEKSIARLEQRTHFAFRLKYKAFCETRLAPAPSAVSKEPVSTK